MAAHKIHVGFGFHVNCYHSYRGDTPDEKGFGSDIRIIRQIIRELDRCNADGIPVKGTWDCENFFSLERILPQYAPDIVDGMRRRMRENGDEQIIMGWSNGALGAMDEKELTSSVALAETNPAGSGLVDLFGDCARIVRPQEMMFSPPQIRVYNKLGVRALCLYYSCVPFDAFRTLIPPLPDSLAFRPLSYEYQGETLTVIPTYSNADVCDAGCLRAWVRDLRRTQLREQVDDDLFLFINMDADAIFWESLDLPLIGSRLANTDGIRGLAREIADLDYVVFDTPGAFLARHAPAGTIRFTEDTADGNFTGYASWAEKPFNRKIWTAVERGRLAEKVFPDDAAFLDRLKLLSTTHFGLATPVLNIARERTANELAARVCDAALRVDGPLTLHNVTGTTLQCVQLACRSDPGDVSRIELQAEGLLAYTLIPMDDRRGSVYAMLRFDRVRDTYPLTVRLRSGDAPKRRQGLTLTAGDAHMRFSRQGRIVSLTCGGRQPGGEDFLQSYLTYGKKRYDFIPKRVFPGEIAGGSCVSVAGEIALPGALRQGDYRFDFFTSDAAEGIFVRTQVRYPYTRETDAISTENSTLGRYTDTRWQEAAPFCLSPRQTGGVTVVKRNFLGCFSAFPVADFGEADAKNRTLASFNNQLTAGAVGVTDGQTGLMLCFARSVLASMAACPMRLEADGRVRMNPFGTFTGPQRHHPNRSGDRIPRTYTLIAPQGKSLAPAYNGSAETAMLCLRPFTGELPPQAAREEMTAFADGAYAAGDGGLLTPFSGDNVTVSAPENTGDSVRMRSPLVTGLRGNLGAYLVRGVRAIAYIARRQRESRKP